jgi:hypothetical protein
MLNIEMRPETGDLQLCYQTDNAQNVSLCFFVWKVSDLLITMIFF